MARHTFYTQIKTSFLYSQAMMNWIIFVSFAVACIAMIAFHKSTFVFMPFFFFILYDIFLYRPTIKDWDMGGFKKMVIDTDNKVIIFDDRVKLRVNKIERVRLEMDERPNMFWLLGLGTQYFNVVHGELIFRLDTQVNTVIYVQYKKDIKKMISLLRAMGIPCRIKNEDLLNEGMPVYLAYLWAAVLIIGSFAFMVVNFFKRLITY